MIKNSFEDLCILDLANNHFGSVKHAKNIINSFAKIVKKRKINTAIKFQFRDLDNFIHKNYVHSEEKYIKRFLETKLSDASFRKIFSFIKSKKIKVACTPFDENSITKIEKLNFDYLKIASVSALDFSLHERAIKNKIPKIISTGGLELIDIDKIVSFYSKKKQSFAIMHCVAIYPSKNNDLNISVIKNLKKRYPGVPIGWSTHEDPKEFNPSVLAYACGARLFEKHIGIDSAKFRLNSYSITPSLFDNWYANLKSAKEILGKPQKKITYAEKETLEKLQRGVFAKKDLKKNTILNKKNTYFAFPLSKKQLPAPELKEGIILTKNIKKDNIVEKKFITKDENQLRNNLIFSYLHELKAMLNYKSIQIGESFDLEISHHKGIKNFRKTGAFLFNIINKEYAKKLIVMLPNQKHPLHHHKEKSESFRIISGKLYLKNNKIKHILRSGQVFHVNKNSWHEFRSGNEGCIFEEISTRAIGSDSYYKNKKIRNINRTKRKTYVNNWFSVKNIANQK
jgi:sialic acid synthase SpsE/mannose-6-phosphate isomerase-like protein (cupin superfamily)